MLMAAVLACVGMPPAIAAEEGAPAAVTEPAPGLKPKRLGPPAVDPVVIGSVRFEVVPWGKERGLPQNGGYIAAYDDASGTELWILKVYEVTYDPKLEQDVQDVFIVSLSKSFFGDKLLITDERGKRYSVDPASRSVERD
ncbi:MAG: hypothetical protein FIA97_00590 [Methylococcaceae bacterium]|nr:hypothetical protein [Methylococcaceae bacterium]